ncbi:MAG: type II toxin-antitoxin system RelE/ParE family toxin [Actinomycetes bacterium]|jgi:mRNA interferase RelE/StbE|nr:type II toxin-antitoxin system RelE/ParE family toxin [Actinomycetes bacterium]
MVYHLAFSAKSLRQLGKLGNPTGARIKRWLTCNLEGCANPRQHGKPLSGDLSGFWRYRVGAYRVICQIDDGELIVIAVGIGHRSSVYH